jgi:DNA-binding response OmpR family regulator
LNNKILVVDDDKEMCEEISEILLAEGYEIKCANNGLQGMSIIDNEKFDLVLLDLKMPELTGYDIIKAVYKKKNPPKIIVLTGRPLNKESFATPESIAKNEEKILRMPDIVMNKPFSIEKLLANIKELISQAELAGKKGE